MVSLNSLNWWCAAFGTLTNNLVFTQKKDQSSNLEKATIFHVRQNSLDVVDGDCYAETNQLQTRNWATANEIKSISSPSALSIIHFNYNLWMISFGRHKERQHNTDFVLCTVSVMWMFSRGQFKDIDHATLYKCCKKKKKNDYLWKSAWLSRDMASKACTLLRGNHKF